MKKFLLKIIIGVFLPILLVSSTLFYLLIFKYPIAPSAHLSNYHTKRLATLSPDYNTIFIGDSSLGNSINARWVSDKTDTKAINIALTAIYGYAGSYNMLKKAIKSSNQYKHVVIMHTPGIHASDVSYKGYLYTINDWDDIFELDFHHAYKLFKNGFLDSNPELKSVIGYISDDLFSERKPTSYDHLLFNDFFKQGEKVDFDTSMIKYFSPEELLVEKFYFLKKIKELCDQKELKLTYVHGPLFDKAVPKSFDFIKAINQNILALDINIIDTLFSIPNHELGDFENHILPEYKTLYTEKYADLICQKIQIACKEQ